MIYVYSDRRTGGCKTAHITGIGTAKSQSGRNQSCKTRQAMGVFRNRYCRLPEFSIPSIGASAVKWL